MNKPQEISLSEIKAQILKTLDEMGISAKQIILFGSRARGDFEEESDYDILVVIENSISIREKREIWQKINHQLHSEFPSTPFDVIVKTVMDFEDERDIVNTISNEAYIEGKKIS